MIRSVQNYPNRRKINTMVLFELFVIAYMYTMLIQSVQFSKKAHFGSI